MRITGACALPSSKSSVVGKSCISRARSASFVARPSLMASAAPAWL